MELLLELKLGGFGASFEEGEQESSGNGDDKPGLGGDQCLGNAGRNGVDRWLGPRSSEAGKGDQHPGNRPKKPQQGCGGDQHRKKRNAPPDPRHFIELVSREGSLDFANARLLSLPRKVFADGSERFPFFIFYGFSSS